MARAKKKNQFGWPIWEVCEFDDNRNALAILYEDTEPECGNWMQQNAHWDGEEWTHNGRWCGMRRKQVEQ